MSAGAFVGLTGSPVSGAIPEVFDLASGVIFAGYARLDNREELVTLLGGEDSFRSFNDISILRLLYDRSGRDGTERAQGDWAFVAWHPQSRELHAARDPFGTSALYWVRSGDNLGVASHLRSLLQLPWVPRRLNEERLARLLVSRFGYDSSATIYRDIHAVPPGHAIRWRESETTPRQYFTMGELAELGQASLEASADALLQATHAAVVTRLPADSAAGTMLTGGLDSSTVTALAARALRPPGRVLTAFTAAPYHDVSWTSNEGLLGDESSAAASVATKAGNIDHVIVRAADHGVVQSTRRMLAIRQQPSRNPGNDHWVLAILDAARQRGIEVLLTGQHGNYTLSARGSRRTWRQDLALLRIPALAQRVFSTLRSSGDKVWGPYWSRWNLGGNEWRATSAIAPGFVEEIQLRSLLAADEHRRQRLRLTGPRQALTVARQTAAAWYELGESAGIIVSDPTQDLRLVRVAFGIPDAWSRHRLGRWVVRVATRDLVPDQIRMNVRRGLQAADLVTRLRIEAPAMQEALDEVEQSALARRCVDLALCRSVADAVRQDVPSGPLHAAAASHLMRGLGAALFLAALERGELPE